MSEQETPLRRTNDGSTGRHQIRNYLVFAILTIGAVIGASLVWSVPAVGQKKEKKHAGQVEASPAPCKLDGSPVALAEIPEASGVVASLAQPGLLWTHKDNGKPLLFALDTAGAVKGRVAVTGASVENWEDLGIAPCGQDSCLYIGDIGDNDARRPFVTVYRVKEPSPGDKATQPATAFQATYPDGPQDAEALLVSKTGGVFIVTKGNTGASALYRFPSLKAGETVKLERVGVLSAHSSKGERITGGSSSADGHWIALRTHESVSFYDATQFLSGQFPQPLRFDVTALREPQGEGVAFGREGALFLVSEGGGQHRPGMLSRGVCTLGAL